MSTITVTNRDELEGQIASYLGKGFAVASRGTNSVTLQKNKKFSVLFAVISLFAFAIPFFIYCAWYIFQPATRLVSIKVA